MSALLMGCLVAAGSAGPFEATWESIDARSSPAWFAEAKFGIFIHWGVYSVPAWGKKGSYAEWYWRDMTDPEGETWKFHEKIYGAEFKYQDFAPMFKAELFEPEQWADLFVRSGARYVVLTSKHHEGFCLWPNAQAWNWNSVDIGPHRDLVGDLSEAVRARGLKMGLYYSLYEWFHPFYQSDVDRYVDEHMLPQIKDLVQRYKPDLLWPDGEWEHPSATWRSTEFLAWLLNESAAPKDIAISDRWGKETRNLHGGYATPEYGGHIPEGPLVGQQRFEECQGMGKSFGFNRNEEVDDYRSATELLHLLIDTVSRGGNLLLDIGPTADGRIPVIMQQRLVDMGEWLSVNGDAIYGTTAWTEAPEMDQVRFTRKGDSLYAICLSWPGKELRIEMPQGLACKAVTLLGLAQPIQFSRKERLLQIEVPALSPAEAPCRHAYVFKLETGS